MGEERQEFRTGAEEAKKNSQERKSRETAAGSNQECNSVEKTERALFCLICSGWRRMINSGTERERGGEGERERVREKEKRERESGTEAPVRRHTLFHSEPCPAVVLVFMHCTVLYPETISNSLACHLPVSMHIYKCQCFKSFGIL